MDGITNYLNTQYTNATNSAAATGATSSLGKIDSTSTKEDLEEAVKSFETYFVEKMLKDVQENLKSDDEDGIMGQYTDFYMDSTLQTLAGEIVDSCGGNLTDTLVAQMARNYGIDISEEEN
jgi:Rod binding domain-containing protein